MKKKIMGVVLALLLVTGIFAPAGQVQAAAKASTDMPKKAKMALYTTKSSNMTAYMINVPKGAKVTSVKSSKKSVAAIKYTKSTYEGKTYHSVAVTAKKAGTTTLSFKVGGKKFSCKMTVYKYKSGFKSLKFGSKDLTARAKKSDYDIISVNGKKKIKVSGKLNSGWKSLTFYYMSGKDGSMKKIKNGKTVTVQENDSIFATAYNKKQKVWEIFSVTYF